jgi:DNA polymerase-1
MMVFDEPIERSVVKNLTYSHVYGGSVETVARQAKLSSERTKQLLEVLDVFFKPITEFREKLTERALKDGFLTTSGNFKVDIEKGDHPGKILGLYAQTHSSMVFRKALSILLKSLRERKMRSKVIFTVHDEIVIDAHPDEVEFLGTLQQDIELVTGFVTKLKKGVDYAEATA